MTSVCDICYAEKGTYRCYDYVVGPSLRKRLRCSRKPDWADHMIELIGRKEKSGYFRWFDSGDLQGVDNLRNIYRIADALPHIKFWLPTKEYGYVKRLVSEGASPPSNVVVRLSAYYVGEVLCGHSLLKIPNIGTSSVGFGKGFVCPALDQDNKCRDCRACWNPKIINVDYRLH